MSIYRLDKLFRPRSVAVIGASPKERSLGRAVIVSLKSAGFAGRIDVVNPNYPFIEGLATAPSLSALPATPDLIVVTRARTRRPRDRNDRRRDRCACRRRHIGWPWSRLPFRSNARCRSQVRYQNIGSQWLGASRSADRTQCQFRGKPCQIRGSCPIRSASLRLSPVRANPGIDPDHGVEPAAV